MQGLDYWRLCDAVSVIQAAILIVGEDPTGRHYDIERKVSQNQPDGYEAARTALQNAINRGKLPAQIKTEQDDTTGREWPDWHSTTIDVEDLRKWLRSRGVTTGFFFPPEPEGPDFMNPFHPYYSPKLAAAVAAWTAVSGNVDLRRGKTVKQAIDVWLRQHANDFGLTKEDGNPNQTGIEELARVANWDTKGGAPKTPGSE